ENGVEPAHGREPARHRDRDAGHPGQTLGAEPAKAWPLDIAAARARRIRRQAPARRHLELETAVRNEGLTVLAAGAGRGGDLDPRHAHAAAVEVEAVHGPAAALPRIGRRAG